jgi:hypothetical protein
MQLPALKDPGSRQWMQEAQANFPNEWRNAETRNTAARNARRGTPTEMRAAATVYGEAADMYDDIVRRNTARVAEETQRNVEAARTRAENERQAAINARADVAVRDDFNRADTIFQQANRDLTARNLAQATERFNQAADQFMAAATLAINKRNLAEETINEAKQRSEESAAFAIETGRILEGSDEM